MEAKKVDHRRLSQVISQMKKDPEGSMGIYVVGGWRVQISRYKQTSAERVRALYSRRRDQGLCIACGKKVTKTNPANGRLYRLCEDHRKNIDYKKAGKPAKRRK
ncbi:MAG TPA: hypothetical protein PKE49_16240 [Leptospiraceae bacterium]|mgnify:FL=1|jgi:hypothetical protein|nr:hypothetical protein [Leptospirales bacterium]HMU84349.1 hypothetical protein [Leptospiraceae bacterium]HMX58074.1 hypothetical protein [Leptospiraceae bacterium]HMZ35316.1 hypothetical protein [Leptospiraceae bacterium]HNE23790.1 hypothetical protein [Leptospiraceae bacterium]